MSTTENARTRQLLLTVRKKVRELLNRPLRKDFRYTVYPSNRDAKYFRGVVAEFSITYLIYSMARFWFMKSPYLPQDHFTLNFKAFADTMCYSIMFYTLLSLNYMIIFHM